MSITQRLYIACLSCYVEGKLTGRWVDATDADADMLVVCDRPGHEETAIHDHEGFYGCRIPENGDAARIVELASWAADNDCAEPFWLYAAEIGLEYVTIDGYEDAYMGVFSSMEEYVEETFRVIYAIPDVLEYYIDWEKMAHDWTLSGDFWYSASRNRYVYVYRRN